MLNIKKRKIRIVPILLAGMLTMCGQNYSPEQIAKAELAGKSCAENFDYRTCFHYCHKKFDDGTSYTCMKSARKRSEELLLTEIDEKIEGE